MRDLTSMDFSGKIVYQAESTRSILSDVRLPSCRTCQFVLRTGIDLQAQPYTFLRSS